MCISLFSPVYICFNVLRVYVSLTLDPNSTCMTARGNGTCIYTLLLKTIHWIPYMTWYGVGLPW